MLKKFTIYFTLSLTLALSALFMPQSANANFGGGWHPFAEWAIRWYDVFGPGADEGGVWIGGAQGVDQGQHDDCWFEAAVASLARSENGCRLLSDMIDRSPSGGYTVTFLDEPDNHYPVTRADMNKYHIKDNALWADVLEAGVMTRFPQLLNGKAGNQQIHAAYGNQSVLGLKILTGHEASLLETASTSQSVLEETIKRNMRMHIAMTAGTKSKFSPEVMVPDHTYTVMAYRDGIVTLRNPWGKNNAPKFPHLPHAGETRGGVTALDGGVIQMDMPHFVKFYRGLAYSRVFHL